MKLPKNVQMESSLQQDYINRGERVPRELKKYTYRQSFDIFLVWLLGQLICILLVGYLQMRIIGPLGLLNSVLLCAIYQFISGQNLLALNPRELSKNHSFFKLCLFTINGVILAILELYLYYLIS